MPLKATDWESRQQDRRAAKWTATGDLSDISTVRFISLLCGGTRFSAGVIRGMTAIDRSGGVFRP